MGEGEDKQHGGALGSPTQHRRCKCAVKLDPEEPIHLVKQGNKTSTFRPHLEEDAECTDTENCRTEKSWKWTLETLDGDATLSDEKKEIATVRAKAGARFELCVTVTYKCWARVEPAQKPDNATASMETVARTCRDKGCAEFRVG